MAFMACAELEKIFEHRYFLVIYRFFEGDPHVLLSGRPWVRIPPPSLRGLCLCCGNSLEPGTDESIWMRSFFYEEGSEVNACSFNARRKKRFAPFKNVFANQMDSEDQIRQKKEFF